MAVRGASLRGGADLGPVRVCGLRRHARVPTASGGRSWPWSCRCRGGCLTGFCAGLPLWSPWRG